MRWYPLRDVIVPVSRQLLRPPLSLPCLGTFLTFAHDQLRFSLLFPPCHCLRPHSFGSLDRGIADTLFTLLFSLLCYSFHNSHHLFLPVRPLLPACLKHPFDSPFLIAPTHPLPKRSNRRLRIAQKMLH